MKKPKISQSHKIPSVRQYEVSPFDCKSLIKNDLTKVNQSVLVNWRQVGRLVQAGKALDVKLVRRTTKQGRVRVFRVRKNSVILKQGN
jgi:hypothetical protein